eukprot:358641-Chlamydomonas_euryale.AAC.3
MHTYQAAKPPHGPRTPHQRILLPRLRPPLTRSPPPSRPWQVIFNKEHDKQKSVSVIAGGGAGHEPAHAAYVGNGEQLPSACACFLQCCLRPPPGGREGRVFKKGAESGHVLKWLWWRLLLRLEHAPARACWLEPSLRPGSWDGLLPARHCWILAHIDADPAWGRASAGAKATARP